MSAVKHACKNHSEKFTSKRCFNCKSYICTDCQLQKFHHIFCSVKCLILWRIKDILAVFKLSREFVWYIILLLLSNVILYNHLVNRIERISSGEDLTIPDSLVDYPAGQDFIIDSIRYGIKGKFKIEVEGPDNVVLSLLHNGNFKETLLAGEEAFTFKDVNLVQGENLFIIRGLTDFGRSILIDSFRVNFKSPRIGYLQQAVYGFRTEKPLLALTFDGGSSNRGTENILEILRRHTIKCTMFLTGQFIQNYPELVRQILDDGHEVGNHSFNHPHFTNLEIDGTNTNRRHVTKSWFSNQLNVTDSLFYIIFKRRMMPYWRAPYGEINSEILFWAAELGYRHIGWSGRCDSWDWVVDKNSNLYRTADQIKTHFLEMERKNGLHGKIILMHLGSERQDDFAYLSLDGLIRELKKRGYSFLKISDFL
jgi:peptidoglycan/xylan/chitin deacetylase (PgdA/CDA1 family)